MRPAYHSADSLPLADVRVLDLSRILAGPFCSMLLGDLGADVVKVEEPGSGDETRRWGPPFTHGESAYYLWLNRNKRGVALDLKSSAGLAAAEGLIQRADVLVENFRPGVLDRLGLTPGRLQALNPRLVHTAISAFGPRGPYRDRPGFDFVIQAMGGIMSLTGAPDGEPMKVGVPIADITTGMLAATATVGALRLRDRTGRSQRVDTSLFETQLAWLGNVASNYLVSGEAPRRYGNSHPNLVPYGAYRCRDGYLALGVGTDAQFARFVAALGLPELAADPRYATNPARLRHRDSLDAVLHAALVQRERDAWLRLLGAADVPCGPIQSVPEVLQDPQTQALQMVVEVPHPRAGSVRLLRPPFALNGAPPPVRHHPPLLGEHTAEVLREWLGFDDAAIGALASPASG